jgi:hypothetical protein
MVSAAGAGVLFAAGGGVVVVVEGDCANAAVASIVDPTRTVIMDLAIILLSPFLQNSAE